DRLDRAVLLEVPEGPAVAARRPLQGLADAVDRARFAARGDRAVCAHGRGPAALLVEQLGARSEETGLDELAESDARRVLAALHRRQRGFVQRQFLLDALERDAAVAFLALAADPLPAEALRHRAGRAGAEERIEHHVARLGRRQEHAVEQRLGLLRRVRLVAAFLEPLRAAADRDDPVAAHLQLV